MTANEGSSVSNTGPDEQLQDVVDRLQAEVAEVRRSRRRLVEAASADRQALERAFHDGVQQHLVALATDVQRLIGLVDDHPAARAQLDEMTTNLREALTEATELAQMIDPPLLEGRGFAPALRSAADRAGITVLADVPAHAGYPAAIRSVVYWSCVEAMASASPGSQVTVRMRDSDGAVTFEVAIAGRHSKARLDRLRDRVEAFDGRFSVDEGDIDSLVHGWLPLSR